MQEKALKTLEFDKIVAMLCERAVSDVGRELAAELKPSERFDEVQNMLSLTGEAETFLYRKGHSPVDSFPDMRVTLKRMHAALFLSAGELLGIVQCLKASRTAREQLVTEQGGLLSNLASGIQTHRSIEEEINRCILSEDELFDGASPELNRIRRAMRAANEKVREKLNAMIRSTTYQKYLQEPLVTIRNGRYVIPVKQEYRQQVPGLIHDQSGSGATLFIEPSAVVELGNELKKFIAEEKAEIERILAELTAMVEPYADDIAEDLTILGEIDLVFAKAALSRAMNGVSPALNTRGYIRIVRGRHPLLPADTVVPIDIWLGDAFRTLIITGPNTGGKTVTLKTVGLFSLMAQAGLFIPANEGSELSVFENVFADIGDEQSIEQSLSTFSSHMTNIVSILKACDDTSLVLFDELGAGTDPVEGAALAMSILSEIGRRKTVCLATTHYSEIKAFALTREGMENASMEFDVDRLCPTYRLYIGIPGKSNAFEISSRLGLPGHIIEGARGFLKNEDVKFEDIISSAQSQHRIAEEERRLAQEARAELDRLREETEKEKKRLLDERNRLQAKARDDAKRIVAEAKREAERLIAELKSLKDIDRSAADREIQKTRDALRAQEESLHEPLEAPQKMDEGKPPKSVKPGDTVKIMSLDQKATVLGTPDAKGEVLLQAGIIKLTARLDDLRLIEDRSANKSEAKFAQNLNRVVGLELDIRGMMVDDAIPVVDRYLDDAAMAGLAEVGIIHGKGTGALRAGIQAHLKRHPRSKGFRIGNYGEGDAGVTFVKLR
ncbi:MAG: endonuclease MutS2 [Eubacteriales bacterium]|nr:endonuclease MutS2 [Eubacteriales bacterium]